LNVQAPLPNSLTPTRAAKIKKPPGAFALAAFDPTIREM
jgi:hypothetical protein